MTDTVEVGLWGSEVELEVYFEQLDYDEPTDIQTDAFSRVDVIWQRVDDAIPSIVEYAKNEAMEIGAHFEEKAWRSLVHPATLFIAESDNRIVAILCEFDLDPEHGLAVVFEDEQFTAVGSQEIVL